MFKKFLNLIDQRVPADLDVHLILDNYATHKTPTIERWLTRHPRFNLHFTPTGSSWLNLVERWFAELTSRKLRRGTHHNVRELNADIRQWLEHWNENTRPYIWINPPNKSSKHSPHTANELTTQDTSNHRRPGHARVG